MDAARIMLTANPGYDPNLMEHGMLTSLWRLHTYITTELTVTVQGTFFVVVFCSAPTMYVLLIFKVLCVAQVRTTASPTCASTSRFWA